MWPCDASYTALAETLGTELVTADRKPAGAPGLRCTVTDTARSLICGTSEALPAALPFR
ncbi:hypothetical protein EES46_01820 [Streptomyces sp. ADI98-10]|nr:hypothetical protein EES46_01820 [Streptomyces sp. ADI98-10]